MSAPFWKANPQVWPLIAEGMAQPWPREVAVEDLRWWVDQIAHRGAKLPGRGTLATRWGWKGCQVRKLLDEVDPLGMQSRQPDASRAPAARQPRASATPAPERVEADNQPESASATPAGRQPDASAAPAGRHTRVVDRSPEHQSTRAPEEDRRRPPASGPDAVQENESKPSRPRKPVPGWDEALALYATIPGCGALQGPTVGMGKDLARILRECGPDEALGLLRWWRDCPTGRPAFLREQGLGLPTIRRHLAEYRALAAAWEARPGDAPARASPRDDWLAGVRDELAPPRQRIRIDPDEVTRAKP